MIIRPGDFYVHIFMFNRMERIWERISHWWNTFTIRWYREESFDYYRFHYRKCPSNAKTSLCQQCNLLSADRDVYCQIISGEDVKELYSYIPGRKDNLKRIVLVSDTHEAHSVLGLLPPGDILIHAGDIFVASSQHYEWYNHWVFSSFQQWFLAQISSCKILVPGNHDDYLATFSREQLEEKLSCNVLINNGIDVGGLHIWGTPLSSGKSLNRAFQSEPFEQQTLALARSVRDVDILITHGHCNNIRAAVAPTMLHIMGHLHEHHGAYVLPSGSGYLAVAAAPLIDMTYSPTNRPIVIDCVFCAEGGCQQPEE